MQDPFPTEEATRKHKTTASCRRAKLPLLAQQQSSLYLHILCPLHQNLQYASLSLSKTARAAQTAAALSRQLHSLLVLLLCQQQATPFQLYLSSTNHACHHHHLCSSPQSGHRQAVCSPALLTTLGLSSRPALYLSGQHCSWEPKRQSALQEKTRPVRLLFSLRSRSFTLPKQI